MSMEWSEVERRAEKLSDAQRALLIRMRKAGGLRATDREFRSVDALVRSGLASWTGDGLIAHITLEGRHVGTAAMMLQNRIDAREALSSAVIKALWATEGVLDPDDVVVAVVETAAGWLADKSVDAPMEEEA